MEKSQLSVVVMLTGSASATSDVSGVEESSGVPLVVQAQRPRAITPAIISAASDFSFITITVLSCFCVFVTA